MVWMWRAGAYLHQYAEFLTGNRISAVGPEDIPSEYNFTKPFKSPVIFNYNFVPDEEQQNYGCDQTANRA